jgi:hypothetical protein
MISDPRPRAGSVGVRGSSQRPTTPSSMAVAAATSWVGMTWLYMFIVHADLRVVQDLRQTGPSLLGPMTVIRASHRDDLSSPRDTYERLR